MPRTRSVAWSELKIGIVGVVAIGLAATLILAVGGQGGFFWQRYPIKTRFNSIQGLKTGAVVRLSGKEVGTVTGVEFAGAQIDVGMEVSKDVRPLITSASIASLGSLSLLGEPIVDVTAAPEGEPIADWGYVESGPAPGSFGGLTTSVSTGVDKATAILNDMRSGRGTLGKLVTDDALYAELTTFVATADRLAKGMEAGRGTLGQLTKDPAAYNALKSSLESLQAITDRLNRGEGPLGRLLRDERLGNSIATTVGSMDDIVRNLRHGDGTAGKLLTDQQLYDRFNALAKHTDELMAGLNGGQGTAGRLLRDQQLYDNLNKAAAEVRLLLADIRKDPKKFLNFKISMF